MGPDRDGPGASSRLYFNYTADDMTKRQVILSMLLTVLSVF